VGVSVKSGNPATVTVGVTYGGVSMTELGRIGSNNTTTLGFVVLFALVSPGTGAKTVTVTTSSGNIIGGSLTFTGSGSLGTAVTAAGDNSTGSAPPTVSVTGTTAGNMVVDAACYGSALSNPGQTQRWLDNVDGASAAGNAAQQTASAGGTITMSWAPTLLDFWGMVAVEVQASGAGTAGVSVAEQFLPPPLLFELAARNQAQWQNAASTVQADAGVAEVDQRSITSAAGIKGGIASGATIAHPATNSTTSKGGAGNGSTTARAVTTCTGIKGGQGTGTATARAATATTAAKGAFGTGTVVQRSSSTAAKATIVSGTGIAQQRTATSSAIVKGGIGSGQPSARATTITTGRHQGQATGLAPTRSRTTVTATHGASGTGRANPHITTGVIGVQVAAFTPARIGLDGGLATIGSIDGSTTGPSLDGTAANTGQLDTRSTDAGGLDSQATITGNLG